MFTGIIRQDAVVAKTVKEPVATITIASPLFADSNVGDSVAVNGCCLTITKKLNDEASFEVVPETLERTTLSHLHAGEHVNCELACRINDRFDGHLVQGHVDGVGQIVEKRKLADGSWLLVISLPQDLIKYVVEKGSIAVDGVSLTAYSIEDGRITISIVPHTAKMTNLGWKSTGSSVNIEVDVMAKYAERLLKGIHG